jgi:RNA polymerase sigma-70 factor (ECF subfamily)
MQTDKLLARRLLDGDEDAFRELFDSFFPKLYRFALARLNGNRDEATDAVQQTFCNAFEHLESYRGEAALYSWMCQICRNVINDRARHAIREGRHFSFIEDDAVMRGLLDALAAPVSDEPEWAARRNELGRLIQATLDCLPDHYGDVLEWKYVDGLSVDEIAQRLALGAKAAESLLTRARNAFRDLFEPAAVELALTPLDEAGS